MKEKALLSVFMAEVLDEVEALLTQKMAYRVHSETLGRSATKMSYRTDLHTRTYTAGQLLELTQNSDIILNVGGIDIHVEEMSKAGWTCRITYNIYGGRTKVAFYSADKRSTMVFRVDRDRNDIKQNDFMLLKRISEGTLNITPKVLVTEKVVKKEIVTVKEVITEEASDLELLARVNENIKKRLAGRPKLKTTTPAATKVA